MHDNWQGFSADFIASRWHPWGPKLAGKEIRGKKISRETEFGEKWARTRDGGPPFPPHPWIETSWRIKNDTSPIQNFFHIPLMVFSLISSDAHILSKFFDCKFLPRHLHHNISNMLTIEHGYFSIEPLNIAHIYVKQHLFLVLSLVNSALSKWVLNKKFPRPLFASKNCYDFCYKMLYFSSNIKFNVFLIEWHRLHKVELSILSTFVTLKSISIIARAIFAHR